MYGGARYISHVRWIEKEEKGERIKKKHTHTQRGRRQRKETKEEKAAEEE